MSKEIEIKSKSGKFSAQRMVEKTQDISLGRPTVGGFFFNWAGLTAPIWMTAAAVSMWHPIMAVIALPVGVVSALTVGAVNSQTLKLQMDKERLKAFDEVQTLYATKKGLIAQGGVLQQILGVGPESMKKFGTLMEYHQVAKNHTNLAMNAPIKGGNFLNRFASLFGKRKAYVDGSQIGEGYGFVLEYTFHMMKLTGVRKIYMVNEERAWEDAFSMVTDVNSV